MNVTIRFSVLVVLLFTGRTSLAQSKLEVKILNLRNSKGVVAIELLDKDNRAVERQKGKIEDKNCTIVFKNLKNGKYAIRYFHDENSNDEIEKNWFGIPTEGYGFSNDAHGTFGPKDFKEWLFDVTGNTLIKVKTTYF